jgi:hypothetical protein
MATARKKISVAEDEERIFAAFVDYVADPRDVCLYHWTDFEIHQMRRVMGRCRC